MHSPSLSSLSFGSCTVLFCWSSVHHRLLEELYPQQGHIQLIPGENSSSQHCFTSISLLVLLSSSAHPSGILPSLLLPCVSLSLVAPPKCKSQNQLFFSQSIQAAWGWRISLMKDSEGLKTALCLLLSFPSSINYCLTDLLSSANNPHLSKGTPGVAQSDSHYAEPQVSFTRQSSERSTAQHSTARRQMLHLLFHSEYTQGAESRHAAVQATPPLLGIGWWLLWRQAGRHSNRLSDLLFIFCLARICGNADDFITFNEAGNWWVQAKKKRQFGREIKANSLMGITGEKHTHCLKVNWLKKTL